MSTKVVKITAPRVPGTRAPKTVKRDPTLYPGFSDRLNDLISRTQKTAPEKNQGRYAWLAKEIGASKPATGEWLDGDKVPRDATFDQLVNHLLKDFEGFRPSNIDRVKTWLLYGEDVIQDPLKTYSKSQQHLLPLALQIISEAVKDRKASRSSYNFQRVVDATLDWLETNNISDFAQISPKQTKIVAGFLLQHSL